MPRLRYTGGSRYALRDGPTWTEGDVHDVEGSTADRLADLEKFELVSDDSDAESRDESETADEEPASVEYLIEDGRCPWCDDYEGEAVAQHASAAHPDQWAAYKEGES